MIEQINVDRAEDKKSKLGFNMFKGTYLLRVLFAANENKVDFVDYNRSVNQMINAMIRFGCSVINLPR